MTDVPRFQIDATDRSDEWSPDNAALLMATQSMLDTPGASFKVTVVDRADEWSAGNPAQLAPTQCIPRRPSPVED